MQVIFADCAPVPLSHLLPDASPAALGLLHHLLRWNPGEAYSDCPLLLSTCLGAVGELHH